MSKGNDEFYRGEGDEAIGKELRTFFLKLLAEPETLRQYYDRGEPGLAEEETPRSRLINGQNMRDETKELLKSGSLKMIEEHILAIEGSYAKPLSIVWSL